ncbi:hypothetical protein GE300_12880 [Rhodobacteraceae bacterium 2CG4]|uniref:Class II aldolase/adducin N-terminal domain-containing protein n=1 Tax=Halovulum marinum TaxID=2662447 RepID=A0A6L5Z3B3_9RHOB|nr:hypothetical protein [Halovulum marinum]
MSSKSREEFAAAHRICASLNLHDAIDGHMSYRAACDCDEMLLSPYPLHWSEVTNTAIVRVNLSTKSVIYPKNYNVDVPAWSLHHPLQSLHPRHSCFIHAHPPFATAITCRRDGRVLPIHQNCLSICSDITYYDNYDGEIEDEATGIDIAKQMESNSIVMLKSHGVVTGGANPAHALKRLYYLERACQYQILAERTNIELCDLSHLLSSAETHAPDPEGESHATRLFAAWWRTVEKLS